MNDSAYYMVHVDSIRRKKRMTVENLCNGICSDRQYRRLLSGEQNISDSKIELFCNKLGISLKDFYYSANEKDKYEFGKIAQLYNALNPLNEDKYKTIFETIKIHRILGEQNIRFFKFCVEKYKYLTRKSSLSHTFEKVSLICNYPECNKYDVFDFVDIVSLNLLAEIETQNSKRNALSILTRVLFDRNIQYLSSESKYIIPNIYGNVAIFLSRLKEYEDSLKISRAGIYFSIMHSNFDTLTHLYYVESYALHQLGNQREAEISGVRSLANAISRKNYSDYNNVYILLKRDLKIDPIDLFKIHKDELF